MCHQFPVFGDTMPVFPIPESHVRAVCRAWLGSRELTLASSMAGGFSGSQVWRVHAGPAEAWVLKSWTSGERAATAGADHIEWVHALLRHLRGRGIDEVVEPLVAIGGGTVVVDPADTHWELLPFIAGRPTETPTVAQASAAAACLARLHVAAESFGGGRPQCAVPASVQRRIAAAKRLLACPWRGAAFQESLRNPTPLQQAVAKRLTAAAAKFAVGGGDAAIRRVATLEPREVSVQAVLRDVWCDHVLYAEDNPTRVAGVIDYHAAALDTPATDIARLFGSWRSPVGRPEVVAAYEAIRPLESTERRLVSWLHATGVIFGLDNWFRWTLIESREFGRPDRAIGRLDRLLDQFPAALAAFDDPAGDAV